MFYRLFYHEHLLLIQFVLSPRPHSDHHVRDEHCRHKYDDSGIGPEGQELGQVLSKVDSVRHHQPLTGERCQMCAAAVDRGYAGVGAKLEKTDRGCEQRQAKRDRQMMRAETS